MICFYTPEAALLKCRAHCTHPQRVWVSTDPMILRCNLYHRYIRHTAYELLTPGRRAPYH